MFFFLFCFFAGYQNCLGKQQRKTQISCQTSHVQKCTFNSNAFVFGVSKNVVQHFLQQAVNRRLKIEFTEERVASHKSFVHELLRGKQRKLFENGHQREQQMASGGSNLRSVTLRVMRKDGSV